MKWFPSFGFQRRKRELQEEIDAHLQMAIADRVARGETVETARQAAAREFGNIPLDVSLDFRPTFIVTRPNNLYSNFSFSVGASARYTFK